MPELPEVEIVRRELQQQLPQNESILRLQYRRKDLRWDLPRKALKTLPGQSVQQIRRRGKYLIFEFPEQRLISHLGMTGSWRWEKVLPKRFHLHDHVVIQWSSGRSLIYQDPRRFGFLELLENAQAEKKYFSKLSFEPLEKDWNVEALQQILSTQTRALKLAIMDQSVIVGVGNIYASESLFRAGISPFLPAKKATREQLIHLRQKIFEVLQEALQKGGSTIQDFKNPLGESGDFQNEFLVYDRKDQPCQKCSSKISSVQLGGRATYWCPSCQKLTTRKRS